MRVKESTQEGRRPIPDTEVLVNFIGCYPCRPGSRVQRNHRLLTRPGRKEETALSSQSQTLGRARGFRAPFLSKWK